MNRLLKSLPWAGFALALFCGWPTKVRAQADRTQVEIVSEAQKQAEITRGEADAERNRVFAEAYGKDPEFFKFYRSLNAYDAAFKSDNTTFVMAPDGEFFEYLKDVGGGAEAE